MKERRIGIFGGTFNPIHSGHLKAAEQVEKVFRCEKILFIPSHIPPHKRSVEIASAQHRFKMVQLALNSYPKFIASEIEVKAKGKSYSIITLNKIEALYPEACIFFIVGIDAFLEIHTWKDYQDLFEKCHFIVISRPGWLLDDAERVLNGRYVSRMYRVNLSDEVKDQILLSKRIFLFQIETLDISSTEIRERIRRGESIEGLVPYSVEEFIKKNNIYR